MPKNSVHELWYTQEYGYLRNENILFDVGIGTRKRHAWLCLLAPLVIGATASVGKTKGEYRKRNAIPGLTSDDNCLGCCYPWCLICQIRNVSFMSSVEILQTIRC